MLRSLHIDIEGGKGGSSRSLFELIKSLDRTLILPLVVCRQDGPIMSRYKDIDIQAIHVPGIFSFTPRKNKVLKNFVGHIPRIPSLPSALRQIENLIIEHQIDIIHLNYEGLAIMGRLLKHKFSIPIIGHSRTLIPLSIFGKMQVKSIKKSCDFIFFISDQESARFKQLEIAPPHPSDVLWNIARPQPRMNTEFPKKAIYLGNIDPTKGTDRLLDIGKALDLINAPPLVIHIYGSSRSNKTFEEEIRSKSEMFPHRVSFHGHTASPESELASAFALIRPSRENDPWGRDVIEATVSGVPVLATGTYQGVVCHNKTGFLFPNFNAVEFAKKLVELAVNENLWAKLSENSLNEREKYCGRNQARAFQKIAQDLVFNYQNKINYRRAQLSVVI